MSGDPMSNDFFFCFCFFLFGTGAIYYHIIVLAGKSTYFKHSSGHYRTLYLQQTSSISGSYTNNNTARLLYRLDCVIASGPVLYCQL